MKNNQWQKPTLSEVALSKKNAAICRSDKKFYDAGVPPTPLPPAPTVCGRGVPPRPPAMPNI